VHFLAVVLVEMQQEKLPSMYSQVIKNAQDKSGLVIDDVPIKINREEEEETYGRGK
jgi:hypothetical protein